MENTSQNIMFITYQSLSSLMWVNHVARIGNCVYLENIASRAVIYLYVCGG